MNIALFGKSVNESVIPVIRSLTETLAGTGAEIRIYEPLLVQLAGRIEFPVQPSPFTGQEKLSPGTDFLFSIGGDGTILEAVGLVGDTGVPIIGINLGKLGFLSGISKELVIPALNALQNGNYQVEQRTLLRLEEPANLFGPVNFALNDVTVSKPNVMSMLTIRTWINNEFLNAYWADGLIIATPTGSTAYSLSCTGPILTPDSESLVITPIASHNLTVRPIVIRDDSEIRIQVSGKNTEFLVSLDSRTEKSDLSHQLVIRKAPFKINLVRMKELDFFTTIREKLNWGLDKRN